MADGGNAEGWYVSDDPDSGHDLYDTTAVCQDGTPVVSVVPSACSFPVLLGHPGNGTGVVLVSGSHSVLFSSVRDASGTVDVWGGTCKTRVGWWDPP